MAYTAIHAAVSALAMLSASTLQAQDKPVIVKPGAPGEAGRQLSPSESVALATSQHTSADIRFMQHMIVHHAQAVKMSELIAARSKHEGIGLIGKRITLSQDAEIAMMAAWLEKRGEPAHDPDLHAHHGHGMPDDEPVMTGMLSPGEMKALAASQGAAFDRRYLEGMIRHHAGAIHMVTTLMKNPENGEDPQLSEFLNAVIADQSAEILRMQGMLDELEE